MLHTSKRNIYANTATRMHGGDLTGNTVIVNTGIMIRTLLPQKGTGQGHLQGTADSIHSSNP